VKIMLTSPHGSSVAVEFEERPLGPDGVDMRLRQIVDTYDAMVRSDLGTGAAIPVEAPELPEIEVEADGE
jgi:hypothetical protein